MIDQSLYMVPAQDIVNHQDFLFLHMYFIMNLQKATQATVTTCKLNYIQLLLLNLFSPKSIVCKFGYHIFVLIQVHSENI